MLLSTTAQKFEIVLNGAVATTELDWLCWYADKTTSALTPGSAHGVTTGATPVDIAAAPAASTFRKITFLSVTNLDTVAATVRVRLDDGGTKRVVHRMVLQPNEQLLYTPEIGFVNAANGNPLKATDIGVLVQAYHANLATLSALTLTAAGTALLDDASADAQQDTLGIIGTNHVAGMKLFLQ